MNCAKPGAAQFLSFPKLGIDCIVCPSSPNSHAVELTGSVAKFHDQPKDAANRDEKGAY